MQSVVVLPRSGCRCHRRWRPHAALLAREKPDNDGLPGALRRAVESVADWERFAWFDANTGQARKTVTLFGNARHAGSTPMAARMSSSRLAVI